MSLAEQAQETQRDVDFDEKSAVGGRVTPSSWEEEKASLAGSLAAAEDRVRELTERLLKSEESAQRALSVSERLRKIVDVSQDYAQKMEVMEEDHKKQLKEKQDVCLWLFGDRSLTSCCCRSLRVS